VHGATEAGPELGGVLGGGGRYGGRGLEGEDLDELVLLVVGELEVGGCDVLEGVWGRRGEDEDAGQMWYLLKSSAKLAGE
jgi:hypothetical protein